MASTPKQFHVQADGSVVCPHRDLSVCADCAGDDRLVEVSGAYFYEPDPDARAELRAMLADIDAEYPARHLEIVR